MSSGTRPPGSPGRGLENVQPPKNPAGPGNLRALGPGDTSEQRLAPLREQQAIGLRHDYPHLDPRRLAILADRLARMESARAWLDQQQGLVRNKAGDVFPVVDRLEKWSTIAEQRLAEAEEEASRPVPPEERLAAYLRPSQ